MTYFRKPPTPRLSRHLHRGLHRGRKWRSSKIIIAPGRNHQTSPCSHFVNGAPVNSEAILLGGIIPVGRQPFLLSFDSTKGNRQAGSRKTERSVGSGTMAGQDDDDETPAGWISHHWVKLIVLLIPMFFLFYFVRSHQREMQERLAQLSRPSQAQRKAARAAGKAS